VYDDPSITSVNTVNTVSVSLDRFDKGLDSKQQNKVLIQGQRLISPSDSRPNTTSSLHQKQQQQHQQQQYQQDRPLSAGTTVYQADYFNKNIPRSL
jgi:hypothetical protein